MAFDWFRVDASIADHPKVLRLAADLKDPNAGWYVIRLLCWLTRYAQRGRLRDGHADVVEDAMKWRGDRGALIRAMINVGLIDEHRNGELEVHDWWEKQSTLVEKANKDAARKRKQREKESAERLRDSADSPRDRRRDGAGTGRDETGRDGTILKTDRDPELPKASEPNPPKPKQESLPVADTTAERVIFDHWCRAMGKAARTVFDDKRQSLIRARLAEGHTVAECKRAIDGCRASKWHMGENPDRKKHNSLELIFRDAAHVEKYRDMAPAPALAGSSSPGDAVVDWFELSVESTRTEQLAKDRLVDEADIEPLARAEGIDSEYLQRVVPPMLAESGLPLSEGKPSLASVWWAYLDDPDAAKGDVPYSFRRFAEREWRRYLEVVRAA